MRRDELRLLMDGLSLSQYPYKPTDDPITTLLDAHLYFPKALALKPQSSTHDRRFGPRRRSRVAKTHARTTEREAIRETVAETAAHTLLCSKQIAITGL